MLFGGDGFERSCSPILLFWTNQINLYLQAPVSQCFGLLAHQAHEPEFREEILQQYYKPNAVGTT